MDIDVEFSEYIMYNVDGGEAADICIIAEWRRCISPWTLFWNKQVFKVQNNTSNCISENIAQRWAAAGVTLYSV